MINANELRIGNYINVYDGVGPKYMYQVTGYDIDEIDGDGTDCFPIPLTPEILEKCGAEKEHNGWYKISICNDWSYIFWERRAGFELSVNKHSIMLTNIQYLHQLQNLYFALTNSELTFKS